MATDELTTTSATFDFASLESTETATFPIINPNTDEDIPGVTMEIYSPESQFYRDATSKFRADIGMFTAKNPGVRQAVRMKEVDRLDRIKNLSCIKAINGFVCAGKTLTDPAEICGKYEFVYTQAINRLSNLSNFIKDSSAK